MTTAHDEIDLKGRKVTRAKVLSAMRECDRLGRVAFLDRYGYGRRPNFLARHDGRSYPSKAILGAAAGLKPRDFFGGAHHTARSLSRLGFEVRNATTGELIDAKLDSLRRSVRREGFAAGEAAWPELGVDPVAYFASGTNRAAEIRGMTRAGADIGVAAPEISAAGEAEIVALAGSDVLVFVDSGAFSEVAFGPEGVQVVRPIDDVAWRRVLALYHRLTLALGSQVWLVAPDRVGDQDESLVRLARYRGQVRELRELGARILVPIQKGERRQAAFAAAAADVLGFDDFVAALPCKKAATTVDEVAMFVDGWKCSHVHLLGLGIRSPKAAAYVAPFASTPTSVSLDSCWIAANAGRTGGIGNGPRKFTAARDVAAHVLAGRGVASVASSELATYTLFAGSGLAVV